MISLSCFISKHLSTALQLASFTLVSEVLQVDLWIWCPFFSHFSCQQCTDFRKSYFCAVTLFWLFLPRSPVVWVLLPPLAGKYPCCPHPPPSVGPSWPRVPWDLPVQPLWLCCIKEMTWLKIKPLILQISSSIWFTTQPHKSRHWHISGTGEHRGVRAAEAPPPWRKSLQDCAWRSLPRAWPDWEMTFSLLLPWAGHSVGSHPQPGSPHDHTNVTLVTFSEDAPVTSRLKISLLLL